MTPTFTAYIPIVLIPAVVFSHCSNLVLPCIRAIGQSYYYGLQ